MLSLYKITHTHPLEFFTRAATHYILCIIDNLGLKLFTFLCIQFFQSTFVSSIIVFAIAWETCSYLHYSSKLWISSAKSLLGGDSETRALIHFTGLIYLSSLNPIPAGGLGCEDAQRFRQSGNSDRQVAILHGGMLCLVCVGEVNDREYWIQSLWYFYFKNKSEKNFIQISPCAKLLWP